MSYADSLRQQAKWVREALDPNTVESQRIGLEDIDVDELDLAAAEIDRLRYALIFYADRTNYIGHAPIQKNDKGEIARLALVDGQVTEQK